MNYKDLRFVTMFVVLGALGGCFGARSSNLNAEFNLQGLNQVSNIMPVAVIGSGPAGLMAATYTARGGKDTFVIEGNKPGGLLMDTTDVANWPGEVSIQGPEIIDNLRQQAEHQGVTFIQDVVERIDTSQWPYMIKTENGAHMRALTIIVATGASPRKLGIPGEQEYWGAGVTSCAVCDAPFYKNEEVVVIGGGDSAVEEAIQLASYAKKITILVRKDKMRAAVGMQDRLKEYPQITIQYNVEPRSILGDGELVTGVELYNNKTAQMSTFSTSGVFLAVGHDPNSQIVKRSLKTNQEGYVWVHPHNRETSVAGIFAAGDVADFRYRQAGTAAGQGISAGLDAVRFLDDIGFTPAIASQIKLNLFGTEHKDATKADMQVVQSVDSMEQFKQLIDQKGVVVFDFWAETCPSCKQMLPVFHEVAQEFLGRATFVTIDTDDAPEIVHELFVHKIPCLLVFKDGTLAARYTNAMSKKELYLFVQQVIDSQ